MTDHLKRSRRQEKRGAKAYGGVVNSGSGNQHRKNDVRRPGFDVEFKTTTRKSYSLKLEDLVSAARHATLEHRDILFGIDFAPPAGTPGSTFRYVVCEESTILDLLDAWDQVHGS